MTASIITSLLLLCKRRVPVASSVPSFRSSHDGVAHCFASHALQTACAGGAVGPSASLVTCRRRPLLRFSCVANGVGMWPSRSLRFDRHMTASIIAALLLRRKRRLPVALSTLRLFVTRQRRSLHRFSCVANGVCLWSRRFLRFARDTTASLMASLVLRLKRLVPVAPSVSSLRWSHHDVVRCFASSALRTKYASGAVGPFASLVT